MKTILKYILLFGFTLFYHSVKSQCFKSNFAFTAGEKLSYDAYYNWGFIWVNAGWAEFKVNTATYRNKKAFHFEAVGESFKSYDWFFKVRENFSSYLEMESLRPLWFERKSTEGEYEAREMYSYDHINKKVYSATANSNRSFKKDTLVLPDCGFDVLTLVYYARNIDFSGVEVNEKIPVTVVIDNEFYNLHIRYLGKEMIETKNNERFNCIKFSALLVDGTIFKGGEDLFVWVTDDHNRIPVYVQAKILVGSVKVYLNSTKGLKNAMEAKIRE